MGDDVIHRLEVVSVSNVTLGGLNRRKKKEGYSGSLPPKPVLV